MESNELTKREQRESIIKGLYAMDLRKLKSMDIINAIEVNSYVKSTLVKIELSLEEIDDIITENLVNWTIKRLNYVDRAILRLATYELKYTKTAKQIIINEAVELSKEYTEIDGVKTPSFNNKVLDNIAKYLKK